MALGGASTDCVGVLKALADPTCLHIIEILVDRGDTCVCEFAELLGAGSSNLSFHLSKLKAAGLVRDRKVGRWMFYRPDLEMIASARKWLCALLDTSRTPEVPVDGSLAAVCLEGDVPLSLSEARGLQEKCLVGAQFVGDG